MLVVHIIISCAQKKDTKRIPSFANTIYLSATISQAFNIPNPLLYAITGVALQAMINLLWHFMRDEEARRASQKATNMKKREEKWNLIEFDQNNEDHHSFLVQCTSKTCPDYNKPRPTTHVISAEDTGDDNIETNKNQRCYLYLVDSKGQVDMKSPIYCPQDDPAKGKTHQKISKEIANHKANKPPKGDGKGLSPSEICNALKEGGD